MNRKFIGISYSCLKQDGNSDDIISKLRGIWIHKVARKA